MHSTEQSILIITTLLRSSHVISEVLNKDKVSQAYRDALIEAFE